MILDMEARLIAALTAVLSANSDIALIAQTRIYPHGSKLQKASYPAVTVQIVSLATFGAKEGWYRATVNLIGHVYLHDDPDMTMLRRLAGAMRGLVQDHDLPKLINASAPARTLATELTVMDAELNDTFEEEPEANVRSIGHEIVVVARPSRGANQN